MYKVTRSYHFPTLENVFQFSTLRHGELECIPPKLENGGDDDMLSCILQNGEMLTPSNFAHR
jgi:hypothetical protein